MEKKKQNEKMVWGLMLLLLPLLETAACRFLLGGSLPDIIRCVLWMALLGGIVLLYLMMFVERFEKKQDSVQIIFICVLLALPCALFYGRMKPMAAFYLGAVLIAALVDRGAGMVFSFYFCAAAFLRNSENTESMAALLALGLVLCLLAGYLKKAGNILEAVVLAGAVTAILYFLRTSRHGAAMEYRMLGLELFSTAAVLFCAAAAIRLYSRLVPETETEAEDGQASDIEPEADRAPAAQKEADNADYMVDAESAQNERDCPKAYEAFLAEDGTLLARMKQEKERLYRGAGKLAEIAGNAAANTSVDTVRCRVIAMYCEVGRLADQEDYIPAGEALMREAGMPEEIIRDIARIHERGAGQETKEAAVVLLALEVANRLNYLKQQQRDITADKVVDSVFSVLLQKGVLDECGLSIKEYQQLKKGMLAEFTFQK